MASAPPPPPPSTQQSRNGNSALSFSRFFESWIFEQSRHLTMLRAAASAVPVTPDTNLRTLVDKVLAHYDNYYKTKSAAAGVDILSMFSPSWTSTTENLFLWCGGWHPNAAIHLLYTKSGMQLDNQLPAFLTGNDLQPNLEDLTSEQLIAADQLQRNTISREREIDDVAASVHEALTSVKMVELSIGSGTTHVEAMEQEMKMKEEGMKQVLEMADTLRLETLREVVALLTPSQAVHFLIAAAELHLTLRRFGRHRDGHGSVTPAPVAQ